MKMLCGASNFSHCSQASRRRKSTGGALKEAAAACELGRSSSRLQNVGCSEGEVADEERQCLGQKIPDLRRRKEEEGGRITCAIVHVHTALISQHILLNRPRAPRLMDNLKGKKWKACLKEGLCSSHTVSGTVPTVFTPTEKNQASRREVF